MELLNILKEELVPQTVTDSPSYSQSFNATGCSTISWTLGFDVPPADKSFLTGEAEVTTLTFPTKAGSTGGDYFVVYDTAGNGWAAALNKSGSDPAPSGAIYTALAAGRKVNVDISAATTAADVAAAVELAFDALVGNPFTTDDSAADGTMIVSCNIRGNTTAASVHNANDGGAGSITQSLTNNGVASAVDVTANSITITSHGYATGQEVQLSIGGGSLPAPFVAATPYYVILVDDNTIKLADTLEDAEAGTPINITDQGTDSQTVTVDVEQLADGTVTLQRSLGGEDNGTEADWVWVDESLPIAITTDIVSAFEKISPTANYYRFKYTLSAGQIVVTGRVLGKGLV